MQCEYEYDLYLMKHTTKQTVINAQKCGTSSAILKQVPNIPSHLFSVLYIDLYVKVYRLCMSFYISYFFSQQLCRQMFKFLTIEHILLFIYSYGK